MNVDFIPSFQVHMIPNWHFNEKWNELDPKLNSDSRKQI